MSVTYISDNDLKVRLQSLKCCLGDKGMTLASNLRLGIDCPVDIKEFNIASIAYDILSCTVTNLTIYNEIKYPYYTFTINNKVLEDIYTSFEYISDSITYTYSDTFTFFKYLDRFILNYPEYSYSFISSELSTSVTITGPCDVGLSTFSIKLEEEFLFEEKPYSACIPNVATYNTQNDANCLTVDQIISTFEYLEQYCCKCFPMYGELDNEPTITPNIT